MSSSILQSAAGLLVTARETCGIDEFGKLVHRAAAQVHVGQADWDSLLGPSAGGGDGWLSDAADRTAAQAALEEFVHLLTLGNGQAVPAVVVRADALDTVCVVNGTSVHLSLRKSSADSAWGFWASYFVARGPPSLLGRRLVAASRNETDELDEDANPMSPEGKLALLGGDELFFATPDRAAILEIATFGRLPGMVGTLASLLASDDDGDDAEREIVASSELMEAARFRRRLDVMLSDEERLLASMRRVADHPMPREFLHAAKADDQMSRLLPLLEPYSALIYNATMAAMKRTKVLEDLEPQTVEIVRINGSFLLFVVLVCVALVVYAFQSQGPTSQIGQVDDLPLYSLRGDNL